MLWNSVQFDTALRLWKKTTLKGPHFIYDYFSFHLLILSCTIKSFLKKVFPSACSSYGPVTQINGKGRLTIRLLYSDPLVIVLACCPAMAKGKKFIDLKILYILPVLSFGHSTNPPFSFISQYVFKVV